MCTSSSKSAQIGCGITLLDQQAERLRSPHTRVNLHHMHQIFLTTRLCNIVDCMWDMSIMLTMWLLR